MSGETGDWYQLELVTVDQNGDRKTRRIKAQTQGYALKEAAEYIYFDIAEAIKNDVLAELPYPRFKAHVYGGKGGDVFTVEVKGKYFTKVIHVKKTKAIYYFGGVTIYGFNIYIPIEAVYHKREKVTYYEVVRSNPEINEIAKDLENLMEEGQS
jgi:hypothetical protein